MLGAQGRSVFRFGSKLSCCGMILFCGRPSGKPSAFAQHWRPGWLSCKSFLMDTTPLFVGLDVGGTTMKAGVVDDQGRPFSSAGLPTEAHKGHKPGLERMCQTTRSAVAKAGLGLEQIAAIGVATPGTMDIPAGIILDPPNLRPWQNVPVRQYVQDAFGVPTAFQNDANAAAFGEYWVGA